MQDNFPNITYYAYKIYIHLKIEIINVEGTIKEYINNFEGIDINL